MKLGTCLGVNDKFAANVALAKRFGCDYIETSLSTIALLEQKEFDNTLEILKQNEMPCEALNVVFPGGLKVVGDEASTEKIDEYLKGAFDRASKIGTKIIVFGSGGARNVPEGFPRDKAFIQLTQLLTMVSKYLDEYNITLTIEHLNKGECNILNTVTECYELQKAVDKKNVGILLDYYHYQLDNDNIDSIRKIYADGGKFSHMHIADYKFNRAYPMVKSNFDEFVQILKETKYDTRLSIEGNTTDFENDLEKSMELLRELV